MACIAPPPPVIEVTVLVQTTPSLSATFTPTHPASAPYVGSSGELDLSCFSTSVKVTMHLADASADQGLVFDAGYNGHGTPLSFRDEHNGSKKKDGVLPGHHQFPGGIAGAGSISISFVYHNDWDGGDGSHTPRYRMSDYGLRFSSNSGGYLGEIDPIVDNGGNPN